MEIKETEQVYKRNLKKGFIIGFVIGVIGAVLVLWLK